MTDIMDKTEAHLERNDADVRAETRSPRSPVGRFADGQRLWTAHVWIEPPRSRNRILLATALVQFCMGEWGMDGAELAAAALDPDRHPDRADLVRSACGIVGRLLFEGRLQSWARPFGGGEPIALTPETWELDDFEERMASSAIDPARPFDQDTSPTHWIFLSEPDWEEALRRLWGGPEMLPEPERRSKGGKELARIEVGPARADDPDACTATAPTETGGGRFLRLPEVLQRTGFSRATLYRRIAAEDFPEGRPLGGNVTGWVESKVDAWIASKS